MSSADKIMKDKIITCRDCGRQFRFTVGEQEFFAEKGLANDPKRCPECRAAHKAGRGGSYSSGADSSNGRGCLQRKMYPAVCAHCGRETEVPFQPRGDRPVYCQECFKALQHGETRGW